MIKALVPVIYSGKLHFITLLIICSISDLPWVYFILYTGITQILANIQTYVVFVILWVFLYDSQQS